MMARLPFNPDLAKGGDGPAPVKVSGRADLTVSQITRTIKDALEIALPSTVHVVGQLSNVKLHTSGHLYFTLKDDNCEIAGVMWRSQFEKLKFKPEDGADVRVSGSVGVFERGGRYQLYALKIEPRGVGAMELAFRQLCEKLKAKGMFDPAHKQKLPRYPQQIAVVTSPTGAAVEDILDTLKRRFPPAKVILFPATVQGPNAPASIVNACVELNHRSDDLGGVDVMIVGRGGGSTEDLWAFNDESVANAIFASKIPVISAVGHEADITIADLVSDVRAATPTAAAELAVPNVQDILDELRHRGDVLSNLVRHRVQVQTATLISESRRRAFADPMGMIKDRRVRLRELTRDVESSIGSRLNRTQRRLSHLERSVRRISPVVLFESNRHRLIASRQRLVHAIHHRQQTGRHAIDRMGERIAYLNPTARIEADRARLESTARRLRLGLEAKLVGARQACVGISDRLDALSHKSALARGFSITRLKNGGQLIRSVEELTEGEKIVTELIDGRVDSRVLDAGQPELFD